MDSQVLLLISTNLIALSKLLSEMDGMLENCYPIDKQTYAGPCPTVPNGSLNVSLMLDPTHKHNQLSDLIKQI